MKKHLVMYLAICLIIVVGIEFYLQSQSRLDSERQDMQTQLSNAISKYQKSELREVNFASLYEFSWEKVYFFGPYTLPSRIDAVLGNFWLRSRFLSVDSNDGITLIVFTRKGRVVQYLEYPRGKGDFSTLETYDSGFSPLNARFVIDKNGRIAWLGDK